MERLAASTTASSCRWRKLLSPLRAKLLVREIDVVLDADLVGRRSGDLRITGVLRWNLPAGRHLLDLLPRLHRGLDVAHEIAVELDVLTHVVGRHFIRMAGDNRVVR